MNSNLNTQDKIHSASCVPAGLNYRLGLHSTLRMAGLLIPLLFVFACNQKELSLTEKAAISNEITEVLNRYTRAIGQDGLLAEFSFLDSSSDFYWIPPGYTSALQYDSIKAIISGIAPGIKSMNNTYHSIQVFPYSATYAGYTAHVNSNSVDTGGNTYTTNLLESGTMIKRKNGWKLLAGHTSLVK